MENPEAEQELDANSRPISPTFELPPVRRKTGNALPEEMRPNSASSNQVPADASLNRITPLPPIGNEDSITPVTINMAEMG